MRAVFAAAALLTATSAFAEVKVLQNFTLIDGKGGAPVPNAAMVIDNGRIKYAGPKSGLKAPAGAETIDLTGKFVMPGITNLHGHLGNTIDLVQDPKNFTRENLEKNLKLYASYGVTSVVSMGSDSDLALKVRDEQRAGRPTMTRIYSAGRGFTGVGGYPTKAMGMKGVPYEVAVPADGKKGVDENAAKHVDLIKIWVDDHLGKERKIPIDLSKSIIDEARAKNLKVAAHIFYLDDAKKLVDAGLYGLAHSVRDKPVDAELIATMKKHGAWQQAATLTREISTFIYAKPQAFYDDPFFTRGVSPKVIATLKSPEYQKAVASDHDFDKLPGFLETAKKNLKKLADAGVNYGFGTDTGPPARFPGYFEHWEMQLMVEAGLTPMQVIQAATKSSAAFLNVSKDFGTLEAGKWADLIVLKQNPLENIKNTRTIETVFIAGNKAN
jgi:imidazolonepropionase-like amidohydrolase